MEEGEYGASRREEDDCRDSERAKPSPRPLIPLTRLQDAATCREALYVEMAMNIYQWIELASFAVRSEILTVLLLA